MLLRLKQTLLAGGGGLAVFAAPLMTGFSGATPVAPVWAQGKAASPKFASAG
jgi:hypothetical protein